MSMAHKNAVIPGCGYHHVALRVADFEATLRFYVEGLGCKPTVAWGEGERRAALLDTGDGNYVEVFAGAKRAPGEPAPEGAVIHFALRTSDCDVAIEKARAAGAEVTVEPKSVAVFGDPPITIRIAFCKGPDGEVIEFFQNDVL
jgi:glyoxylase I family protein